MRIPALKVILAVLITIVAALLSLEPLFAQQGAFRNAPASASEMKNPYAGSASAAAEGKKVYSRYCAQCHGNNRQGMGPAPALDSAHVQSAKAGELFWFITNGKPASGMPAWPQLSKQQKWQVVAFVQSK